MPQRSSLSGQSVVTCLLCRTYIYEDAAAATRRFYPEEPELLSLPIEVSGLATRKIKFADTWSGVIPCHFFPSDFVKCPYIKPTMTKRNSSNDYPRRA